MRRFIALLGLGALLAACGQDSAIERHAFYAVGTVVEISIHAPSEETDAILRDVETALLAEEQRWRAWETGELADLNRRLAAGESVAPDASLQTGLQRASELHRLSGGRFNPYMGRLVEHWGFHNEERPHAPPPSAASLAPLLPPPGPDALLVDNNGNWRSDDPRLWLDMGAIAKGFAVEAAITTLQDHGVRNAIVNAGGDLKVLGQAGSRPWRIGVRHPRAAGVLASLEARDGESVFTSGDYERFFEWNGERFHHVLDPATGFPARGVASVTVIHPEAALADAAATALFVAADEWPELARNMRIKHVMVVRNDGRVELTPAMRERVRFEQDAAVEVQAP